MSGYVSDINLGSRAVYWREESSQIFRSILKVDLSLSSLLFMRRLWRIPPLSMWNEKKNIRSEHTEATAFPPAALAICTTCQAKHHGFILPAHACVRWTNYCYIRSYFYPPPQLHIQYTVETTLSTEGCHKAVWEKRTEVDVPGYDAGGTMRERRSMQSKL